MERYITTAEAVYGVGLDAARHLYGSRPPSEEYAARVARLLVGTAAQESGGFQWRRQATALHGRLVEMSRTKLVGAWSLWQLEEISVRNSIQQLAHRTPLYKRLQTWLWTHAGLELPLLLNEAPLLRMNDLARNDYAACAFARLHYLWKPQAVPPDLESQATYWKQHYNTPAGKGKPQEYLASWSRHCAGKIGE